MRLDSHLIFTQNLLSLKSSKFSDIVNHLGICSNQEPTRADVHIRTTIANLLICVCRHTKQPKRNTHLLAWVLGKKMRTFNDNVS